ncbi:MAG: sulfite reductase flavoprotein subunit alpha, partial [Pseudomonadota bacterium]
MKIPYIPEDAPFNEDQRAWLAGFLAGLHSRAAIAPGVAAPGAVAGPAAAAAPQVTTVPLNILYGTQTGNAEAVAEDAAEKFQAQGFTTRLHELDAVEMDTLAEMEQAIMVVSTYGEGEMPDNGEYFWEGLSADSAPRMEQLKFGVIALGDTSYDQFCQAGKLIDMRLEQLGATRLVDRVDCDVDFEDACEEWLTSALAVFELTEVEGAAANDTAQPAALVVNGGAMPAAPEPAKPAPKKSEWTRKNPFHALVMDNHVLSGEGSAKEIRHVAFHLGASGMEYAAGDALGVVPTNSPALVSEMLLRLGASKDQAIADHDEPLGELLANRFEIRTPSREFLAELEKRAEHEELSHVLSHQDKEALDAFLWGKDTLDLLNLNPRLNVSPEEFLSWCKPLQHRAYSISSSPLAHPGEVHLTVAAVRWQKHGREHQGV